MQSHLEHVAFLGKISRTYSFLIVLSSCMVKCVGKFSVANSVNYISFFFSEVERKKFDSSSSRS